jgi:hypothetical protein
MAGTLLGCPWACRDDELVEDADLTDSAMISMRMITATTAAITMKIVVLYHGLLPDPKPADVVLPGVSDPVFPLVVLCEPALDAHPHLLAASTTTLESSPTLIPLIAEMHVVVDGHVLTLLGTSTLDASFVHAGHQH